MTGIFLIALMGYLIGSIPVGYLAGRIAGIDIRTVGSGNIGATNVGRVLGKRYGYPVFFADFFKGFGSVTLAAYAGPQLAPGYSIELLQIVAGIFCVLGNTFPVWLKFRGGKGVATSAGLFFGLAPLAILIVFVIWMATYKITRYVSIASITAAVTLPVTIFILMWSLQSPGTLVFYLSVVLAAVVVLRHHSNISRLLQGTEERFNKSED